MSAGNSAYSPLPQSNSDSDCSSEEELHVSQGNRIVNRATKVHNPKGEKQNNDPKNNVVNYKLLGNDGDVELTFNKFQSAAEDVSVVKPDGGLEIFSTSRKICFVFSLLLCVFTTVAFIWVLPCNVETCLSASDINFTWEENLPNLEIHGPISLISDQDGNQNLLFLTKSLFEAEKNSSKSGLQCLKGKNGFHAWNLKFEEEPTDIDCKLIDINTDGIDDCLIYGKNFLKAVNPISGKELWDIQKSNKKERRLHFTDFPQIVSDLDRDEVKELLLPCSFGSSNNQNHLGIGFQNNLVIISGKTGVIINKPLQIKLCSSVHNLMFENSSVLSYTCIDLNEKESFQKINFMKVYKTLKNTSKESLNFPKLEVLKQHVGDSNSIIDNGFRIIVKNQGNCPQDCNVLVVIEDENKRLSNKTVYSFSQKNTFGMAPVALKSNTETSFILKFWKWDVKPEKTKVQNDEYPSRKTAIIKRLRKKLNWFLNSSKALDKEMLSESDSEFQRLKRTASKVHGKDFGLNSGMRKGSLNSGIFNMRVITENVVKIALNQSQFHVSNITKDEIVQICKKPEMCLPKARKHRRSVMVARFDEDGRDKLITFTSKYVHQKRENDKDFETWQFRSRIRVINL